MDHANPKFPMGSVFVVSGRTADGSKALLGVYPQRYLAEGEADNLRHHFVATYVEEAHGVHLSFSHLTTRWELARMWEEPK